MCALSESRIRRIKRKTPVESVGVGFPNPSGEETSTMDAAP